MRTTIDAAGRLVIPKQLRDQVGVSQGEVEIEVDGADLRIRVVPGDHTQELDGFLVVPPSGVPIDDAQVRRLRDAGRR